MVENRGERKNFFTSHEMYDSRRVGEYRAPTYKELNTLHLMNALQQIYATFWNEEYKNTIDGLSYQTLTSNIKLHSILEKLIGEGRFTLEDITYLGRLHSEAMLPTSTDEELEMYREFQGEINSCYFNFARIQREALRSLRAKI